MFNLINDICVSCNSVQVLDVMLTVCQSAGPQIVGRMLPDVLKSILHENVSSLLCIL